MAEEQAVKTQKLKRWWKVAAATAALLVLSQLIWRWETWPVRDLLQQDAVQTKGAR